MIKLFADGASLQELHEIATNSRVVGFTTNPSLVRASGAVNYETFCRELLVILKMQAPNASVSIEVLSDDLAEMKRQAERISALGDEYGYRVYVKIPITNTKGELTTDIVSALSAEGHLINVTAVFTMPQVMKIMASLKDNHSDLIISMFAGRIADTMRDPIDVIKSAIQLRSSEKVQFLWASCREVLNYKHAVEAGCDIITMVPAMIKKMNETYHKDMDLYSLETVQMFYNDAVKSGYMI